MKYETPEAPRELLLLHREAFEAVHQLALKIVQEELPADIAMEQFIRVMEVGCLPSTRGMFPPGVRSEALRLLRTLPSGDALVQAHRRVHTYTTLINELYGGA